MVTCMHCRRDIDHEQRHGYCPHFAFMGRYVCFKCGMERLTSSRSVFEG